MSAKPRSARTVARVASGVLAVLATTSALMTQVTMGASAVAPSPLVVTPTSGVLQVQYSDPVTAAFSASSNQSAASLSASATGLPEGVEVVDKTPTGPNSASWTITGAPTDAPGSYLAHVTVADHVNPDAGFNVTVDVGAEDAAVTYTGPTSVVGPDWDADEVPVTMTAQVTQAADGTLGSISTATVDFTDTVLDEDLCVDVPVTTAGTGPGTASCTFQADLSDSDEVDYAVGLTVGGSYLGSSASDTAVRVSLPEEPDPVLPDTTLSGPSGWLLATTGTFGYASTMPDSDTDFFCRFDGAKVGCKGSSVTLTGLSQRTHRFTVVAENEDGDTDETPAARDFAVPVDDAGLATSGTWKRKSSPASYLDTYSQAQKKGVALTYKVANVRELMLMVNTGKKYGVVKVYLDGALLKTVKTAGKTGSRSIALGHFSGPKSGIVKIVTTSAKTVRIDGLGVSTAAF